MALRPGEVGAVGREGDCPGLAPRLLVKGRSGHQELADELGLICETSSGCYLSSNKQGQVRVGPRVTWGVGGAWHQRRNLVGYVRTRRLHKNMEVEPSRDRTLFPRRIMTTSTSNRFDGAPCNG